MTPSVHGRTLRLACAATFVLASGLASAAADRGLLEAARQAEPAVVETLKDMVRIESGSQNVDGLARMAEYTERRLQALGAQTERIRATRGPGTLVKGTLTGSGARRLMLIAHMDTVYPAGTLATQPVHQDGNRLYGPGIADDKGGIAVILHALEILKNAGWRDYARITVLFNPDEEVGSIGSGETIAALADEHDFVFSCEPTSAKDVGGAEGILLGAAGARTVTLEVKGRSAHAGAAPQLGRNALVELAHQILETRDIAKGIRGVQLNWTTAQAGVVRNQIPERAVATADVRTTVPGADEQLRAALESKVAASRLVPDTTATITMLPGRPAFVANDAARDWARRAQAIYAELDGRELRVSDMAGGATDAAYAGRSGKVPVIESFGLAGFGYHARDEYVELDSIVPRLYLMTRMLQALAAAR